MTDHICIQTYPSRNVAELDAAFLNSHGIETMIDADDLGGWMPGMSFGEQGVRLWVPEKQAEDALDLLNQSPEDPPTA
jgi:hypothetical protein